MTQWEVVGVIVVLVGLFTAVCVPIIKSTKESVRAMTELNITMKNLADKLTNLESNNTEAHRRIWVHNDEQDAKIQDHETRITIIEKINKGGE